jgi:HD-like signal output (HDOD) protein
MPDRKLCLYSRLLDGRTAAMNLLWMALAALAVIGGGFLLLLMRRSPPPAPRRTAPAPRPAAAPTPSPSPTPADAAADAIAAAQAAAPVPAELADFRPRPAIDLPVERQAAVLTVFKDVPRPPRLLHHLLSPDFFGGASSAQLVDLISAEPLIAAKVLAAVNSPLYALSRTVDSIGQAVTYLGLNTVRSLCLQYIVRSSFLSDTPERKRLLEETWTASAMASELAQRLTQALGLDDRGSLVSAVVLSFLGRVALVATTPRGILATLPSRGLLARERAEQQRLGLCAAEIGRLLMTDWGLPPGLVADAADLDRVLVTPAAELDHERGRRLALAYACARLGERMAAGGLRDLAVFDLRADDDVDLFHLRTALHALPLARLPLALQAQDLAAVMQRMQLASGVLEREGAATA